jgi:hypothetical protein
VAKICSPLSGILICSSARGGGRLDAGDGQWEDRVLGDLLAEDLLGLLDQFGMLGGQVVFLGLDGEVPVFAADL